MNVLSLFDGISCGQIALERAGIKVDNYYASEIDKWAIQIAQKNYPDTIQLGDVTKFDIDKLPKIDLLIGGSPCQGFSFAGKQLNFDDPRSALFFVYVHILQEIKPKYFLLENVVMKKEYQDVITQYLGVEPIKINSALVSAQNRNRLYWTNIPNIKQPEDRGLLLRDVLEDITEFDRTCKPRQFKQDSLCHHCADATDIKGNDSIKRVYAATGKSPTLTTMQGGHREPKVGKDNVVFRDMPDEFIQQEIRKLLGDSKYKDNFMWKFDKQGRILVMRPDGLKIQRIGRIEFPDNKAEIVTSLTQPHIAYRKLTPIECERLQTVPDNYTEGVSKSQRYKMLGNGWTVDVIAHIFGNINEKI